VRLSAFRIDGFGIFRDQGLAEIAPGLTVFQGANEAGKSTLLAFLRAMLYGFERAGGTRPRYELPSGGPHGGWLELVARPGMTYRLERHAGRRARVAGETKLVSSDGALLDAGLLLGLLGGMSRESYFNLCAFSMAELQALESLTGPEVQGRIWTAGVGLVDVSLVEVESRLRADREKLYKPRGQDWPVNNLLRRLGELRAKLRAARDALDVYEGERRMLQALQAEAPGLTEEADRLRHRQSRLEQYEKAWEVWGQLQADRAELSRLGPPDPFPTDGVGRLEQLRERQRVLADEARQVEDDLFAARAERGKLVIDEALIGAREGIEALARREQELAKCLRDIPRLADEAARDEASLREQLRKLGPDWTEERCQGFDDSLAVMDAARDLGEKQRREADSVGALERDGAGATRAAVAVRDSVEAERRALSGLPEGSVSEEELRGRLGVVAEARQALAELVSARDRLGSQRERQVALDELHGAAAGRASAVDAVRPGVPGWVRLVVAIALAGAVAGFTRTWEGAVVGVLVGVGAFVVLRWSHLAVQRAREAARERVRVEQEQLDRLLAQAEEQAAAAEMRVTECAAALGAELASWADVEAAARQLDEVREALHQRRAMEAALVRAETEAAKAQEAQTRLREELGQARERLRAAREAWQSWLSEGELPTSLTPEGFSDIVQAVRQLRESLKSPDQTRRRIEGMKRDVESVRRDAAQVWALCGRKLPPDEELPAAIIALVTDKEDALAHAAAAKVIDGKVADLEGRLERAGEGEARTEEAMAALMAQAGVADEEGFRRRGEAHAKRQTLEQRVAEGEKSLGLIAGFGDERRAFEAELEQMNPGEIALQLNKTQERLGQLTARQAEVNQELGARRRTLEELETSEEVARCLQEQSEKQEQLREQIEEYGTLSAALYLLRKAREEYERERQPAVVAEASRAMEKITGGAYHRVMVPPDQFAVRLEAEGRTIKEVGELSTGTQQQLYLAMRLAYVTVQSRAPGAEPLPLIMDEVLVNFDPERARRTAELILDVARENQVLVFTCHPETVALFRDLKPDVPVVSVVGGRLLPG